MKNLVLLVVCLLFAGCATTIPRDHERSVSTAFSEPGETVLGQFFQPEIAAHPGQSGMALLTTGEWGFRARAGLLNQAQKSIDVQYYIWEVDIAGSILWKTISSVFLSWKSSLHPVRF